MTKPRIVAAMSGGVDSSVTAAILARSGYDVVGVTLQLYSAAQPKRKGACCAGQDIHDARRVAETLGIPHYVLDYEARFKERVIADFAETYARGETPIPCVRCNERVKFADLMQTARDLGAEALATGHYVRRIGDELHQAVDPGRDQSYFLFATTREQLSYLRFPLGGMEKREVRALAAELGLVTADKPDSQDICFVPDGKYANIVEKLKPDAARRGEIVGADGRVLGTHPGVIHFTVGQRKGLGLAGSGPAGNGEPLFVLALDAEKARVTVGPREMLSTRTIALRDVNWLGDADADVVDMSVKVRSMRPPVRARLFRREGKVELAAPEEAVAPGQACVFYDGTRVLGGGWIARAA
ncbi:MAG: tRNA 2-thiouridine(34) synthase MnmA [Alphaproteobacteria bacterium]|nr:tRNA 2-thiouridine(34) synthase MnmA [Alphaproteobacteria bacterium]